MAQLGSTQETEDKVMDEKSLIELWNIKRSQIIHAQFAPAFVLTAIMVLSSLDIFVKAMSAAKYFTLGVAAITGILSMISQYATIREAESLIMDLNKIKEPSALAQKIAASRSLLSLTAIGIVGMGIAMYALTIWAVLGK